MAPGSSSVNEITSEKIQESKSTPTCNHLVKKNTKNRFQKVFKSVLKKFVKCAIQAKS